MHGELWQQALFKCMFVIASTVVHVTNCIRKWLEGEVRPYDICACVHSFISKTSGKCRVIYNGSTAKQVNKVYCRTTMIMAKVQNFVVLGQKRRCFFASLGSHFFVSALSTQIIKQKIFVFRFRTLQVSYLGIEQRPLQFLYFFQFKIHRYLFLFNKTSLEFPVPIDDHCIEGKRHYKFDC